jgi:hypothetical protein
MATKRTNYLKFKAIGKDGNSIEMEGNLNCVAYVFYSMTAAQRKATIAEVARIDAKLSADEPAVEAA